MSEIYFFTIAGLFLAIGGWLVFLTSKYSKIAGKTKVLFDGKISKNLGGQIEEYMLEVRKMSQQVAKSKEDIENVRDIAFSGYQKTGFLRYNPYGDVGGNQSFSLCLLNGSNDGFVISSIHSREGTRVYGKSIKSGHSDHNLSEEEIKVIEIAKGGKKENV